MGSSEISVFDVRRDGLELRSVVPSGGSTPNSITVDRDVVHALNNGGEGLGNITGFRLGRDGSLVPIADSTRPLSAAGSDPAQVSFTPDGDSRAVTEKGHALDFETWRSLVRRQGLTRRQAIEAMVRLVTNAKPFDHGGDPGAA